MRRALFGVLALALVLVACESQITVFPDGDDGDRDDGHEATPCVLDVDCESFQRCVDRVCLDICTSDRDCGGDFRCANGLCLPMADGDNPDGDRLPDGDRPDGDRPDGDRPDGDSPDGDSPDGDLPQECASEGDCDLGFLCIEGRCIPGCRTDRDCPGGRICNTEAQPFGACVQCVRDSHCREGEACRNNVCKRLCSNDSQCADLSDTPRCDSDRGYCVACIGDADCEIGHICADSFCVPGCRSNRDCPAPLLCDTDHPPHGGCFTCVTDAHCSGTDICRNHTCVKDCAHIQCPPESPHCLPETGECVGCYAKEHCGYGKVCADGTCVNGCQDENDCPRGQVCQSVGQGFCVECFNDSHCTGGKICVQNRCGSEPGCTLHSDCPTGEYCHPNLRTCTAMPSGGCQKNEDCLLYSMGLQMCDPLTRRCIESCISQEICLPLVSGTRWLCVEGGCYECTRDAQCIGVACDPSNWLCRDCTSRSDCLNSAHYCNTENGNCYECLQHSHCGNKYCKSDSRKCVECLQNSHCTNPGKPLCGKDNTCIAPCTDLCTEGSIRCNPDDHEYPICYFRCGDYDNDPCLEWGTVCQSCGSVASCQNNQCVCAHECSTSDPRYCDAQNPNKLHYCYTDSYDCRVWTSTTCYYGCSNGQCN